MKIIPISGVIGWDVYASDIRRQLTEAGAEEVEVQISSPGGFVVEGLEIFNLIRRHTAKVTTRLMGMAASMASYIALAGSRVLAEENVVYMIHNALGFAMGDHNDMRKAADIFEGLSRILAREYARKSGKSIEAIRALMDEETYYFGPEAQEAGFVDEIVPVSAEEGAETEKDAAVAVARARVEAALKIVREVESREDVERAVALIGSIKQEPPAVGGKAAAQAAKREEGQSMTLDQLKTEHPEVYRAAVAEGSAAGIVEGEKKERERVTKLQNWGTQNPACKEIVAEAIVNGKSAEDVLPQLMAAIGKAPENPPAVATAQAPTASGEQGKEPTDADIKAVLARLPRA